MTINRVWSMPNKHTFLIKPIKELVDKYIHRYSIDPFANECKIANDIDNSYDTSFHMDAIDFLKMFADKSVDTVLYDPPYSPRQVSESYKN